MSFEVQTLEKPVEVVGEVAIRLCELSKCYQIYERPHDRLKQTFFRGRRNFYREFWALRGVNLEVQRGETLGIIGRNGSGKSTLLQILCGTLAPTTGSVETRGRVAALLELGAGFHPDFTGRENVFLNARILGLTRKETEERFDRIAAFADIGAFMEQPVKTYSSGMYVRLAFSVVVHVDADILVVDEALAVGDAFFTQKCMRFMRGFREKGTVVFVSHDAGAVTALCDRVLWLDQGTPQRIGPAKAVNEAYLAALFGEINQQREEERTRNGRVKTVTEKRLTGDSAGRETSAVTAVREVGESFGLGGASILGTDVVDDLGGMIHIAEPRQRATVRVHFKAVRAMEKPIVGFYIKDRLGQNLFGQNTACAGVPLEPMETSEERVVRFSFEMPLLQAGHYAVTVAVAEGTAEEHAQHHWIHEACMLTAPGRDASGAGLVGIPMAAVECRWPAEGGR